MTDSAHHPSAIPGPNAQPEGTTPSGSESETRLASEKTTGGASTAKRSEIDENFVESFSEEILDSFIPEGTLPTGKKTSTRFWLEYLRLFYRLITPRANQLSFTLGFWVLRCVGLVVLASWYFFGFRDAIWDDSKLLSGLGVFLLGPLVLRAVEFILESLVLKGATKESWHNFWDFKRMMTPRSIQTAFFIGFWFLVVSGLVFVCSGFRSLIIESRVGSIQDAIASVVKNLDDANVLARDLLTSDNYVTNYIRNKMNPATIQEMDQIGKLQPLPDALKQKIAQEATDIIQTDQAIQDLKQHDWKTPPPPSLRTIVPKKWFEAFESKSNPFARILKGLLLMVFGPLALRLTAESIILFFRVNETLTDISKQLEIANKRADNADKKS